MLKHKQTVLSINLSINQLTKSGGCLYRESCKKLLPLAPLIADLFQCRCDGSSSIINHNNVVRGGGRVPSKTPC